MKIYTTLPANRLFSYNPLTPEITGRFRHRDTSKNWSGFLLRNSREAGVGSGKPRRVTEQSPGRLARLRIPISVTPGRSLRDTSVSVCTFDRSCSDRSVRPSHPWRVIDCSPQGSVQSASIVRSVIFGQRYNDKLRKPACWNRYVNPSSERLGQSNTVRSFNFLSRVHAITLSSVRFNELSSNVSSCEITPISFIN